MLLKPRPSLLQKLHLSDPNLPLRLPRWLSQSPSLLKRQRLKLPQSQKKILNPHLRKLERKDQKRMAQPK